MKSRSLITSTFRFATIWGLFVLATGWSAIVCSWCAKAVDALSVLYIGFSSSLIGGLFGFSWAFISVASIGAAIAIAKEMASRNDKTRVSQEA